uniref:Uncharacterized protein n=1 Tax=Romanomermis culicivorax TaxID=13658 RepID=A0A915IQI2_ROMCU
MLANLLPPPPLSQNSTTATTICASTLALSQIPPPSATAYPNNDTIVAPQQLCVQYEIQEQVQSTNARLATLAEQMQQLISTTTAMAVACNLPTPRPPPVTSRFHCQETPDIYIPKETLHETEPALAFGRLPVHIKPEAPSMDTLYNHKFSCTVRGKEEISCAALQRRPLPMVNIFGFLDYPPEDYYDHPQPR